ncbi:OmpA family protein [Paraburkholderia sp.]|uniref:OmpA family protein n=1 Tax=Paraburkholderia sp. TaxID=1926495 RepID=UPI00286FAC46|nr:OmpA family protein [Paraburkholderia sp.]
MKRCILVGVSTTVIAGCAVNPQTGQPEFSPAVKTEFKSVFDNPDPCSNNDRNIAAVIGAGAGAVLGHYLGKNAAATVAGTGLGAIVGMMIGHAMDERRCNLYHIAQQYQMKLASAPIKAASIDAANGQNDVVGLDVQMGGVDDEFLPGTATLTPRAKEYLGKVADQYNPKLVATSLDAQARNGQNAQQSAAAQSASQGAAAQRQLLIVGHSDERDNMSGPDLARLSEARAKAVAEVFRQHGVPAANIAYQGAGDSLPIASNGTAQGRSDNNRVEVVDVPSLDALKAYASNRSANPANFAVARQAEPGASGQDDLRTSDLAPTGASLTPPAPAAAQASTTTQTATATHKTTRKKIARSAAPSADTLSSAATSGVPGAASAQAVASTTARAGNSGGAAGGFGFDGKPLGTTGYQVNLGAASDKSSMFSFITAAHADTPVIIGSCLQDHPHTSTPIRSLATNQPLKVEDSLPGLYGQPWFGSQGDAAVALLRVYVPSDAAAPVPPVTAEIYRREGGGYAAAPIARFRDAPVNVYRGADATLYRVFLQGSAQCVDLRVPTKSASGSGLVVYPWKDAEYKAVVNFSSKG